MTEDEEALYLLTHEECKKYYDNGQPEIHYWYKDDKINGEYKYWHRNGKLATCYWYKDNNKVVDFIKNPELKKEYGIDD